MMSPADSPPTATVAQSDGVEPVGGGGGEPADDSAPKLDPAQPLEDKRHEKFCRLYVANGRNATQAYMDCQRRHCTRASAAKEGSRWLQRRDVRARVGHLDSLPPSSQELTDAEILAKVRDIVRSGRTESSILSAISTHLELTGRRTVGKNEYAPDPAKLADLRQRQNAAIVSACGRDGTAWATVICADGVRELSGTAADVADKLALICNDLRKSPRSISSANPAQTT